MRKLVRISWKIANYTEIGTQIILTFRDIRDQVFKKGTLGDLMDQVAALHRDELTERNEKLSISFALKRWQCHDARQIVAIKWILLLWYNSTKNQTLPEISYHFIQLPAAT